MKHKRGQLSIFIIVAIVILIAVGLIISLKMRVAKLDKSATDRAVAGQLSVSQVRNYVENCVSEIGSRGVYIISVHGGYLHPSGIMKYNEPGDGAGSYNHYYFENIELPFLIDNETVRFRQKNDIEKVLSNYILFEVGKCINNLTAFKNKGLTFEFPPIEPNSTSVNVSSVIAKDEVILNLKWPLSVKEKGSITKIDNFQATVNLRLGLLYNISRRMLDDISAKQPSNLAEYCEDYIQKDDSINIYLESNPYTYEYMLRIVDMQPLSKRKLPLKFKFAAKNIELCGDCVGWE